MDSDLDVHQLSAGPYSGDIKPPNYRNWLGLWSKGVDGLVRAIVEVLFPITQGSDNKQYSVHL